MLTPPFCPNSDCPWQTTLPVHGKWYHGAGSYETKVFAKRKLSYQRIFQHLINCDGIRATARIMGVNQSAITNRIGRMTGTLDKHDGVFCPKYVWM
ncbi:MAG: helix-turn-helix domain-containing protein [bacterium]